MSTSSRWTPGSWRQKPIEQIPAYPDVAALEQREAACKLSAAGFCRRGPQAEEGAGRCRRRQGFPAAGRRLRRKLRRAWRQPHPRLLPRAPADVGGADLAGAPAGGENRPHRRPVRQAALRRHRNARRRDLPSYRGDIVNDIAFTAEARTPDPQRMRKAYGQSAATLNLLRAFAQGGYADLENVHRWTLGFVADSPAGARYKALADRISETLDFMDACGITSDIRAAAHDRFLHQP